MIRFNVEVLDGLFGPKTTSFCWGGKNKCWCVCFFQSKRMKIGVKGRWWWKWETMLTSIILFKVNWCTLVLLYFEVYFVYCRIWWEQFMSTSIFVQQTIVPRSFVNVVATFASETIHLSGHIYIYMSCCFFGCSAHFAAYKIKTPETKRGIWNVCLDLFRLPQGKIMMRSPSIWHASPWTLTHA